MTIAFLPWPVSIYEIPGVSIMPPSAHRLSNRVVPMCPNFQVRFAGDEAIAADRPILLPSLVGVGRCRCVFARAASALAHGYHLTSRAETNWRGLRAAFMSGMLVSSS
jgi:hypothetical protein